MSMKKLWIISLAAVILAACSSQDNSEEEKKVEDFPIEEQAENDAKQTGSKEENESEQQVDEKPATSTSEKQNATNNKDKGEVDVEIKKDAVYVKELKKEEQILDATYSIFDGLDFATLTITVADTVTKEQVEKIAKEQEVKLEEKYPELIPVVIVKQKGKEIYSNLDEE